MESVTAFLAALALFIGMIAIVPVRMEIRYCKRNHDDLLTVGIRSFKGLPGYQLKIPVLQLDWQNLMPRLEVDLEMKEKPVTAKKKVEYNITRFPFPGFSLMLRMTRVGLRLLTVNRRLYKSIHCLHLRWHSEIGLPDAAATGLGTGLLWNLKNMIYVNLSHLVQVEFEKPDYRVMPCFNEQKLNIDFNCIFAIRAGYIMVAGIQMLFIVLFSFVVRRGA